MVLAAAAVLLAGWTSPALADDNLTVELDRIDAGGLHLIASVASSASDAGKTPTIEMRFEQTPLPTNVEVLQAAPSATRTRAVVIVLDASGSMAGAPLEAAQDAALDFIEAVPADLEIGLVTISDRPKVLIRPTRDRVGLRNALAAVRASGQTALYAGLRQASDLVSGYAEKHLLVLSDGRDTRSVNEANAVSKALVSTKTTVDVVAFRAFPDGLALLRELAESTGGTAYQAANAAALATAFRAAAGSFRLRLVLTAAVPADLAGKSGTLTITANSAGVQSTTTLPVQFPLLAAASPPVVVANGPGLDVPPLVLYLAAFAGLLSVALLATAPLARWGRKQRLEQLDQFRLAARVAARPTAPASEAEGALAQAVLGISDRIVKSRGLQDRMALKLDRAGMKLRPHEWAVLRGSITVAGAFLGLFLLGLIGFLLGGVAGWLAVGTYRSVRQARRTRAFSDQLPDALQLIIGSLRSGFSLPQAVDAVTRDAPPGPITAEFGRAMAETRIGVDVSDALERVADRTGNDDLTWAVMAVRIQRDTGGNLAEVLETTGEAIRERDRLRRQVRALSAEGRLSAYILVGLPIAAAVWMLLTRRDYLRPLWTTGVGLMLSTIAVLLVVAGAFWMSRWVKVEV